MPARLTIQTGISAGASHFIERPVIRIGSDPASDVCLPSAGVAAHALTVEFRDGGYRVYNRTGDQILLGGATVEPNGSAVWRDAAVLELAGEHELVLDHDVDVQASYADDEDWSSHDEEEHVATQSAEDQDVGSVSSTSGDGSNTMLQVAVIVACLLGCVFLIARDRMRKQQPDVTPMEFSTVIEQALNDDSTSRELVQRLQFAESAVVRGREELAQERYERLRDDLLRQEGSFDAPDRAAERQILDFVEFRLAQFD